MLTFPTSLRVFAHRFPTDMRKSFHGLVGIIESELGQSIESGHLFLFFNRRRDRVKMLYFTGDGLVIVYRMLERGTFETPRGWRDVPEGNSSSASQGLELRTSDRALIWEGIDLSSVKRRKRWRRAEATVYVRHSTACHSTRHKQFRNSVAKLRAWRITQNRTPLGVHQHGQ